MRAHSKETQASLTPRLAVEILKEGNERFINNLKAQRNLMLLFQLLLQKA